MHFGISATSLLVTENTIFIDHQTLSLKLLRYSCDHWLKLYLAGLVVCGGEGVNMINNPNFLWQPNIKYIYGYGCLEIVDKLDLEQFLAHISQNHHICSSSSTSTNTGARDDPENCFQSLLSIDCQELNELYIIKSREIFSVAKVTQQL